MLVCEGSTLASRIDELSKRIFDISAAGFGLFFSAPILAIVALAVRITMGSPVVFRQVRPGRDGKPFTLYKIRTMTDERDEGGNLLPPVRRITRLGQFLRATSIDELPQLWNVIRGDMSLVGPRPLLVEYLELYTPEEARRHNVRPGITGWAQVNGRNATTWAERLRNDVWYVDNRSFWLDMKILALTILQVLRRRGVNHSEEATMTPFRGTQVSPEVESD